MATNYVLIDLENVQPSNMEILVDHPFKIFVFVGANQYKVAYDMAVIIQKFGENAQYIKISAVGANALDFHIAFYIGKLSMQDPSAYFHIISKDKGYDPLIKHLKERKIQVQRENNLSDIPILKKINPINTEDKIITIVKQLAGIKHSKPKKIAALSNAINSLFKKQLTEVETASLIKKLQQKKYIVVKQNNITYNLPH